MTTIITAAAVWIALAAFGGTLYVGTKIARKRRG